MQLSKAYSEIESRLEKLDFESLHRDFHRFPFALYDDSQAFINGRTIEKPAGFLGNTAILYDGSYTAIWQLAGESFDYDVLTSKLVHEMLHAYQQASKETRWADERKALFRYRYDAGNVSARLEEADCMRKCFSQDAPNEFERLLGLRRARMERYPYEYDYEARIEQIEGTAHFVELFALKQLDAAKAERRWEQMFEQLAAPENYFPVRAVTYLSGAAFIASLRRYSAFDTDALSDMPFAVASLEGVQAAGLPAGRERADNCLAEWRDRSRKIVAQAIEKGSAVLESDCRLIAWNVYDAIRYEQYAILTAFLGYIEGELPKTDEELYARMKILNGDFVVEVNDDMYICHAWRR